jgi:hypothetical protein
MTTMSRATRVWAARLFLPLLFLVLPFLLGRQSQDTQAGWHVRSERLQRTLETLST